MLKLYLTTISQKKMLPREEKPLEWWRQYSCRYKELTSLAKKYLCIPASEATSERVFSVAGLTATRQRSSLLPEHVDMLVFLNSNKKLL